MSSDDGLTRRLYWSSAIRNELIDVLVSKVDEAKDRLGEEYRLTGHT